MNEKTESPKGLPSNAKMVFKGLIFETWQWEQKLFDGTVTTFERLRRTDSALVVPTFTDGNIMMLSEEQPDREPFIGIPAGRVEEGETAIDAAKRELLEETGLASDSFVHWFSLSPYSKIIWTTHVFIARDCKKIQEANPESGEKIEPFLVNFDEFIEKVCQDAFRHSEVTLEVLKTLKKNSMGGVEMKKLFFGI